jgi:predicted flap endonuclease-1-like 5' DNA nuclease
MTDRSTSRTTTRSLADISGIGPAAIEALRRLGVRTVHQLARASPEHLAAELRAAGSRASRTSVDRWIAEAQARVHTEPVAKAAVADDETHAIRPPDDLLEGWTAGPGFTVWFLSPTTSAADVAARRTIVYSERGPGPMKRFEGTEEWVDWVREEAGLTPHPAEWKPPPPTAGTGVTVSNVAVSRRSGVPPAIIVDVAFEMSSNVAVGDLRVTCALAPTGTDDPSVSATQIAEPGEAGTRRAVCALSFPPAGRYVSQITIRAPTGVLGSFSGPLVNVVE